MENYCLDLMKHFKKQREIIPPWSISFKEEMICREKTLVDLINGLENDPSDGGHSLYIDLFCGNVAQSTQVVTKTPFSQLCNIEGIGHVSTPKG